MNKTQKSISVLSLVMINLAALGGIRTWAPMAECGFSAVFFLLLAVVTFFLPLALISAELATSWPQAGGVYVWVKEAFGHRLGFFSIWLLWIENVIWYPTILSFIASTITFAFNPELIHSKTYTICLILFLFWSTTLINLKGIKISNWFSSLGAICGTFIPSILIIILGSIWYSEERSIHITFTMDSLVPSMTSLSQWALFGGIMVSLLGMEMSAVHAADVQNPQRNYPKAILLSAICVIVFSILGVLSIAMVIPQEQIVLSAGCLQAFALFLESYGLTILIPFVAFIVAIGALGSMSTWIVGPCKGLIAAAKEGDLPNSLRQVNSNGVPKNILLFQAILVTILSLMFLLMPTVNSAYWMLLILTTQLYLIMYVFLFAAALWLRYKKPEIKRPFQVPGGLIGMWVMAGLGTISSIFAFFICFIPPAGIASKDVFYHIGFLIISILVLSSLPWLLRFGKRSSIKVEEQIPRLQE